MQGDHRPRRIILMDDTPAPTRASATTHAFPPAAAIDQAVGARVRELRQIRRLSQGELGQRLGVTFQQMQKYERGLNRMSAGRLFQVAEALDVPVSFFFDPAARLVDTFPRPPHPGPDADRSVSGGHANDSPRPTETRASAACDIEIRLLEAFRTIEDEQTREKFIELAESFGTRGVPVSQ